MAVRNFRLRFPTDWTQIRTPAQLQATWARTQAAAVTNLQAAAMDAIRAPTRPTPEAQAPASLAGNTTPGVAAVSQEVTQQPKAVLPREEVVYDGEMAITRERLDTLGSLTGDEARAYIADGCHRMSPMERAAVERAAARETPALARAASHPAQATTSPAPEAQAQGAQPPASPAGSTPAERQFTPEETAVLYRLAANPPPGVGQRPAVPLSPAPSPGGPATAADSPSTPTTPPIVLEAAVDISQLGAAGGPLSPRPPLGVARQPGVWNYDLNRPQDPQTWPDPAALQAATRPAQQAPPLGPLATLPRPTRN